jgi:ubiquinone/menaquinone biosynthesis C-methylase UbiE
MGFYNEQVLPRVVNVMLGNKEFAKVRKEACEGLHGDVIELGFGSGLNLPHLPPEVTGVWTVDPSRVAMRLAAKRVTAAPVGVHVGGLDGARLAFPDDRFDSALSTMTLCTIPDVGAALRELRRVMKPGGCFHFAEHGHSPDANVARTQDRFDGFQQKVAGGCHLNRPIDALLTDTGFEIETMRNYYLKGPKLLSYMYAGRARNPLSGQAPE